MSAVAPPPNPGATQSSLAPAPVQDLPVQTPSGQVIRVLGLAEQYFYDSQAQRYQAEYAFTNVSDLADLDQLLFLELMSFRLSNWLGAGRDYDGLEVDVSLQRRSLKEVTELINKVKTSLGMTKSQRDKEKAESVGAYLTTLKQRAKEFGVHRETQLGEALALINQLFAIVGSYDRADEVERRKLGFPDDNAILDWIRLTMRPKYDAIDQHFRQRPDGQKFWLKDI